MIKRIRKLSNWLIFKFGKEFLNKYNCYYKGDLVDLGCGEQPHREFFLNYADNYIGVDWTNSLHNNTKADIISDLNKKIELKDNSIDTAVSLSVMEHLCEPQQFLDETFRILKPNGYFILQVPFQWWIHEGPYDYFRYTPYGLKYMLKKAGFEIVELSPTGGFFTSMVTKLNYFTIRMFKLPKFLWVLWLISLIPFWTLGQLSAPLLDKLFDKDYNFETSGFWVVAKK